MLLRDYQDALKQDTYKAWDAGKRVLLDVLPTGGGKTAIFSSIMAELNAPCCSIAHRQELVSQMSLTLARYDMPHRIVGPSKIIKDIVALHVQECGFSYYDPAGRVGVAGVDTLIRRAAQYETWLKLCRLWNIDEGHHVLRRNKWGKAVGLFGPVLGLGVTATPERADGRGLGKHADGVYEDMLTGPPMRELIERGYLTDYRIFNPPSDLKLDGVAISKTTGDYNPNQLKARVKQSHLVGDVVSHYLRLAYGKTGLTFVTDIETAEEEAERFKAAGVPAAVVSADTPAAQRAQIIRDLRNRVLWQVVNVDLFGEGFDAPAIEVVSMARPTESFGLFCQQFGRALRPMDGKQWALIIDHVGNVTRHGLPDAQRIWTLDARERRTSKTAPSTVKTCPACTAVYERYELACPFCGHIPEPALRSGPTHVDGDLQELDFETLQAMRGMVQKVDIDLADREWQLKRGGFKGAQLRGQLAAHGARQTAQYELRNAMTKWATKHLLVGKNLRQCHKLFFLTFGVDVLTAQALGKPEALALSDRIKAAL